MTDALRELSCSNCGAPMHAQSIGGEQVIKCDYCGRSHVFAAAPKERARAASSYHAGDAVLVKWGSQWWPGRIERVVAEGAWEISYDGWSKSWNETVGASRLARAGTEPGEEDDFDPAVDAPADRSHPPATEVPSSRFRAGQPVRVLWKSKWWDGRVVRVIAADAWEISYDGYATSWNEVVGPDRIADRGGPVPAIASAPNTGSKAGVVIGAAVGVLMLAGVAMGVVSGRRGGGGGSSSYTNIPPTPSVPVSPAALVPGAQIQIFWHSSWFNGHVLRVEPDGSVRVHYDNYSASWDESVPVTRLRVPQ